VVILNYSTDLQLGFVVAKVNNKLKIYNMPSKEYRILVNGLIVNREYTSRNHKIMIDIFEERGLPYKTEIVDLDYNVQIF